MTNQTVNFKLHEKFKKPVNEDSNVNVNGSSSENENPNLHVNEGSSQSENQNLHVNEGSSQSENPILHVNESSGEIETKKPEIDLKSIIKDDKVDLVTLKNVFATKALPLLQNYLDAALGNDVLKSVDGDAREEVWELLKTMVLKADDRINVPIELQGSPDRILLAVENGFISIAEGERLMKMYLDLMKFETKGQDGNLNQTYIPNLNIYTTNQGEDNNG